MEESWDTNEITKHGVSHIASLRAQTPNDIGEGAQIDNVNNKEGVHWLGKAQDLSLDQEVLAMRASQAVYKNSLFILLWGSNSSRHYIS